MNPVSSEKKQNRPASMNASSSFGRFVAFGLFLLCVLAASVVLLPKIERNPVPSTKTVSNQGASTRREIDVAPVRLYAALTRRSRMINSTMENKIAGAETGATGESNVMGSKALIQRVRDFAAKYPADAAKWIQRWPTGSLRNEALQEVAIAWANLNYTDAAAWARGLADEGEKEQTLRSVAYEVVRQEPVEALRLAVELPPDSARDELVLHCAQEWASRDVASALDWAQRIPEDRLRAQTLAAMTSVWADSDPFSAAELALSDLPPGRLQNDALIGIVQRWAQQDPEVAANWVAEYPEGELRSTAIANVATIWALKDPSQADAWHRTVTR